MNGVITSLPCVSTRGGGYCCRLSDNTGIATAIQHLDRSAEVLAELHEKCCEPGRSPSMILVDEALGRARIDLTADEIGSAGRAISNLEDAGAQIGRLQVGCCAPDRMPLYASFLENLALAQRAVALGAELGH